MIETYFVKDGRPTIHRNPRARLVYGVDLADWLKATGSHLVPEKLSCKPVGVQVDGDAFIDGDSLCAWVTGMDLAPDAENSLTFMFECVDGSAEDCTLYFIKRP